MAAASRIQLAPSYVLHHAPWRDSSRIYEVITRDHGRLSLFARGVRGPKSRLAGVLHPTPAVGGEPFAVAEPLIPALEGLDRGWYAGPVGWTDTNEDGEFCVALRCALLRGPLARCYAGVGVVRDSDPAAELAETDVKLAALLPVLAG